MQDPSIYSYIKSEEKAYQTEEVRVGDNWYENMRKTVQMIFHLKHGRFFQGENDFQRSFREVMFPIIELANWTEDLEVKDVVFYIEQKMGRVLSFFIKKYHDEIYVKENDLDTLFDKITDSDNTYGAVLVQKNKEILPLNSIAFCDQTDILGGPISFVHHFTPSGLRKMKKNGWGEESNGATISIDDLIMLADHEKDPVGLNDTKTNKTTGKTIEVYITRGDLPEHYLLDNNNFDDWYGQVNITAFYTKKDGKQEGVVLYRKKESESSIKLFSSDPIVGFGLGYSVGRRMLHPQVWTNFLEIHKMGLLEAGGKVVLQTDDPDFSNRNQIDEMDNMEIATTAPNTRVDLIQTTNLGNIQAYENSINLLFGHAQFVGAAQDPLLGKEAVSGTTFRGQERTVAQGQGPHKKKGGKRAKFIEELYRDWFIPEMARGIIKGQEFLAELSNDEMRWVFEQLAQVRATRKQYDSVFSGDIPVDYEILLQIERDKLAKGGNKMLLKVLEDEFDGVEIKMGINIAGKQKDLASLSDKVLSIFQFVFANPQGFRQAMQIPTLSRAFEDILEFSGMNQASFNTFMAKVEPQPPQQPQQQPQQPRQELALQQPQS